MWYESEKNGYKYCNGFALMCSVIGPVNIFSLLNNSEAKLKPTFEWLLKKYFRNYYSKGGITGQCNFCTWTESQFSLLAILLSVETPQELCYQRWHLLRNFFLIFMFVYSTLYSHFFCRTRFKLPALPLARPKKKKKENTAPGKWDLLSFFF